MRKILLSALLTAAAIALPGRAVAVTTFVASISHENEVANPPIPNEGSGGFGVFRLSDDNSSLSYEVQLFGLDLDGLQTPGNPNDNVTRVHFHAAPAGTNGGIVFGVIDANAALRNDLDDVSVDPVTGRIRGVWDNAEGNGTTLAAQLANLNAQGLYFNIHTADHGGGEVRGQVRPVPEPSTIVMGGLGVLGLIYAARRRRNRG